MAGTASVIGVKPLKMVDQRDLSGFAGRFPLLFPGILAIDAKHAALGGAGGILGAPSGAHARTPSEKGWFRHYAHGSIYWTSQGGAHEIHGAIRDKWASLGWEASFLGFPVGDEVPLAGGAHSVFQGGAVYWSPASGAHEVHGAILEKYRALGEQDSFLGYPVRDERSTPDGRARVSDFEAGQIAWSPSSGAAVSATTFQPGAASGVRPKGLGGDGQPEVKRRLVCAAHMDLTDDENWPDSDEHASADKANEVALSGDLPQDVLTMEKGAGGEMRVELTLIGKLRTSGDVVVQGTALLYEGTSETTRDLDGNLDFTVLVPRDLAVSKTVTVFNEDEGGDKGVVTMTFSNLPA